MFTSNVQFGYPVRGVGSKLSRLVYLAPPPPPAQDLSQAVSSVSSYCTITFEYLVVRDVNIISVKLRCYPDIYIQRSVRLSLSEGLGASCPGWFILPPPPRIWVR